MNEVPTSKVALPKLIQGGMGVAISGWRLARAVSQGGQLGVVSGTGLDQVLARRLQLGDPEGDLRRAIDAFPCSSLADHVMDQYFRPSGKTAGERFRTPTAIGIDATPAALGLVVLANFVEVWLAREGHDGVVGINLLEKIPFPNMASLYGAMLAGVDYVLMGAGIPWQIPGILDRLSVGACATMKIALEDDESGAGVVQRFVPSEILDKPPTHLCRPKFLGIISSSAVGSALLKRATGKVDGFVFEGHVAGGHNAPPRGALTLNENGEPIYGDRDSPDFAKLRELKVPFWIGGGMGSSECLKQSLEVGAAGVQVGTAFAFCEESGLDEDLRLAMIERIKNGTAGVFTDPLASPTGYPFKVAVLEGTLSDPKVYESRPRVCDAGYLRHAYRRPDGEVGYRCPGEPVDAYVRKGGKPEDAEGRKCLCNALIATVGLGQVRPRGYVEPPLVTAGTELAGISMLLSDDRDSYSARDVVEYILSTNEISDPEDETGVDAHD